MEAAAGSCLRRHAFAGRCSLCTQYLLPGALHTAPRARDGPATAHKGRASGADISATIA